MPYFCLLLYDGYLHAAVMACTMKSVVTQIFGFVFRDRYEAVSSPSSFLVWGSPLFCVQCDGVCHYRSLPLLSSAGSNTPPSGRWSGSSPWWWGRGREEELCTPMRPRGHAHSHTCTSYRPRHLSFFLFFFKYICRYSTVVVPYQKRTQGSITR